MSTRTRTRNAYESSLNGSITSGAATITLNSTVGLTQPLYLVIEPESPTKREFIRVGSITGSNLESVTRGEDGSASGAQAHDSGVVVRAVFVHQMLDELFTDIEALETADTNHFGGTDTADHPEATITVRGFISSADKVKLDGIATAAVADHAALTGLLIDDHTQYLLASGLRDVGGNLLPDVDDTRDLGNAAKAWRRAYLRHVYDLGGIEAIDLDDRLLLGEWEVGTDFLPNTDLGSNLGNATQSFNRLYAQDLYNAAGAQVVSLATKGLVGDWKGEDFDPIADVTHDLGDATFTWRRLYVDKIYNWGGNIHIDIQNQQLEGAWQVVGNLDPSTDLTRDLGDGSLTWRRLYVDEIWDRANVRVIDIEQQVLDNGTWQVDGALHPQDDNAHDLGSSSLSWQDIYAFNIRDEGGTLRFDLNDWIRMVNGGASDPPYAFTDQINSGMYWVESNKRISWANQGNNRFIIAATDVVPGTDNIQGLGNSTLEWKDVWANDVTINTSDPRLKENMQSLKEALDSGYLIGAIDPVGFEPTRFRI